jgi:hypothetical protein
VESYENASRIVAEEHEKLFLATMAARKRTEAVRLRACYGECDSCPLENGGGPRHGSVTKYMLDVNLRPISSSQEALRFASVKEHGTLELYSRLADLEENEEIRGLFVYLVGLQREHLDYIHGEAIRTETSASFV